MPGKRLAALLLGAMLTLPALAPGDDTRATRIGQQLICTCGCTQGALVCNHVGCPTVTQMRQEIVARAQSSDSDELVLQAFVQEYGPQVRAVPAAHGFTLLAWVMPWIAALAGLGLVFLLLARWARRTAPAGAGAGGEGAETAATGALRREIESELERELGGGPKR